MTPRERAEDLVRRFDEPVTDKTDYRVQAMINMAEQAITAAIEEDRKTRPHVFVGRNDRWCEVCNEPDRDERHLPSREKLTASVEYEREECKQIANEEAREWATHSQGEESAQRIAYKIRARSNASRSAEPKVK